MNYEKYMISRILFLSVLNGKNNKIKIASVSLDVTLIHKCAKGNDVIQIYDNIESTNVNVQLIIHIIISIKSPLSTRLIIIFCSCLFYNHVTSSRLKS